MNITEKSLEVLRSCFLVYPPSEDRRKKMLRFQHGKMTEIDETSDDSKGLLAIYLRKADKDDFLRLLRETEVTLKGYGISGASSQLAESVLVLNIAYRQKNSPIPLDEMLANYQEVEATTFIGIPKAAVIMSGVTIFLGDAFRVGRFMTGLGVHYRHRKLFDQSPNQLSKPSTDFVPDAGGWIMREPVPCRVLSAAFDELLATEVRDGHLNALAIYLAKSFQSDFENDQRIPVALGAPAFDTDALFSLNDLRIDVTFGEYARSSQIILNFGDASIPHNICELGVKYELLSNLLGNKPLGSCPDIDRMLSIFSGFLLKANTHETGGRPSEAFIHCVFALDLVLGGKQDPTKNTTRRAAVIYSAAAGVPFKDAEKELKSLFGARSKYVHEGREISDQKNSLLVEVCKRTTECLLRARNSAEAGSENFITKHWYPRLDLLVAAMDAGVELGSEQFRECGVNAPSTPVSRLVH